jgi:hypothetical protein
MGELPECIDGLPNLCGSEQLVEAAIAVGRDRPVFGGPTSVDIAGIDSGFAVALHMHQPLIPAGGPDLRTAAIVSNLQGMLEHPDMGDNHNAPVFHWCYKRMGELIPQLLAEGRQPRIMLEYSGTLLHGLRRAGLDDVFDVLRPLACDPDVRHTVEWLGRPWGHAVAPSTPVQDYWLHVRAWQHHFAAIFGLEALGRVRGFSPAEMGLPNHPDVAYEFVKTLNDCGYQWLLVQEHTSSGPTAGRWRARICPTAWSPPAPKATPPRSWPWSKPKAATANSSARCSPTTRPEACLAGRRVGEAATETSSYCPLPALRPSSPGGGSCRPR